MNASRLLKALADDTRLRIAHLLAHGELTVSELVAVLDMSQPRVSRHLKILAEAGVAVARREGQRAYYRAMDHGQARLLLSGLEPLFAAEAQLAQDLAAAEEVRQGRVQETARIFSDLAEDWRAVRRGLLGDFDLESALLERLPETLGSVADLGCGPGELLERLSGRAGARIGVDNAPGMLDVLRQRFGDAPDVSVRMGELTHLPLADGEVQAVVLSLALHHLAEPWRALEEASRVLAPGGLLLVADLAPHNRADLQKTFGHLRLGLAPDELAAWLEAAGFAAPSPDIITLETGLRLTLALTYTIRPSAPAGPAESHIGSQSRETPEETTP